MTRSPDEVRVGPPQRRAAGLRAVASTARHALDQMGVRRTARTLRAVNQPSGFDCPGCAWPEPSDRSHAEFCENGAKAVAEEATRRRAGPELFARHSIDGLRAHEERWLGQQGRLTTPMVRRAGRDRYEPLSWDDAFGLLADELGRCSPDEAVFYTSGRTSNEAAFLYQLFARTYGTNNLPDCSNMCHESSGAALTQTIGVGKGTVTLNDIHEAELLLVVGQNPGSNHPRMLTALERAKRNGARIVAVNPLPEAGLLRFKNPQRISGVLGSGTALADRHIPVRVNGDQALFLGVNRLVVEADTAGRPGAVDRDFLRAHTTGIEELTRHLDRLSWADLCAASGLAREDFATLAEEILATQKMIVCWAMGLTQHRNAVPTIREIVNLCLLRGSLGRPGAGLCPVRGHSNVQGDRTMGIWERPTEAFLSRLDARFGGRSPRRPGVDTVKAIRAMRDGQVAVFLGLGGNLALAAPDTAVTLEAMQRCRVTAHVSTKLNRSHLACGRQALILPCLGRTERDLQATGEQFVTVEDSMGLVHASAGVLAPASDELLSEVSIVTRLARRVLGDTGGIPWASFEADYGLIRDAIADVIPGFEDFNSRVRQPGGFALAHPVRDERRFPTPDGLARLTVNELEPVHVPEGRLLLQTVRSHDQYNTTIYGLDDRYRGIHGGRRVVFVHEDDLAARGLEDGAIVDIVSEAADGERRAAGFRATRYPLPPGTCAAYFPEANVLVPLDSTASDSNTPTSKSIVVRLEPAETAPAS